MPLLAVKWRDTALSLDLPSPHTVAQVLAAALASLPTIHPPSAALLIKGRRLTLAAHGGEGVAAAAQGRPLLLYGSTAAEAHEAAHPPEAPRLRNDLPGAGAGGAPEGYLFRAGAPAPRAAPAPFIGCDGHDGSPRYGWGRVVVAEDLPDSGRARQILTELASHRGVLAVMRRRGWFVPELGEMSPLHPPPKPGCIGYNVNHGQCIRLLLRHKGELQAFRRVGAARLGYDGEAVLDVLYHELAHNVAHAGGDHPPAFYELEREIKLEAQAAGAWEDAGQQVKSALQALGGGAREDRN